MQEERISLAQPGETVEGTKSKPTGQVFFLRIMEVEKFLKRVGEHGLFSVTIPRAPTQRA